MNNLDKQYTDLLQDILDNGVAKQDRTGTGTISVFGRQIRHKMSEGFPLLTTKKMPFRLIATELIWFLRGDTNIKFLVDNDCHIWTGDAYKNYQKQVHIFSERFPFENRTQEEFTEAIRFSTDFAKTFGDLGPVYGKQWRGWTSTKAVEFDEETFAPTKYEDIRVKDQINDLISDLKTNPDSRRLMVNAWNVGELDQMVLPPCHYGFQVYTRELTLDERIALVKPIPNLFTHQDCDTINLPKRAISLMWNQRSVDTFLGLPFNIASYGLLLEIIAKAVNMVPDELIGNLGDTHLYENHIDQAREQIGRELSLEERKEIYEKEYTDGIKVQNDEWIESKLKTRNIPTRTREPYPLPKLLCLDEFHYLMDPEMTGDVPFVNKIGLFRPDFFTLEHYQAHPHIKAPLSN